MTPSISFIIAVILIAYLFDFINGFHDAANSIATIVATKVLTPGLAVLWAAFFNFVAFLFFKLSVANTVGVGLVNPEVIDAYLIFSALLAAIVWNLITWYFGLPSSSSHALIGGLGGAGFVKGGLHVLILPGFYKVIAAIVISPLLGSIIGFILVVIFKSLTRQYKQRRNNKIFKYLQLVSSALLSLSHGANDAQKTMGIIAVLLFTSAMIGKHFYIPFWVIVSCNLVIALGTLVGGWRIVNTVGKKITHLNTMRGCSAESGAAITIGMATYFGIPVSTTHTVTGAVAGVGASGGLLKTHWNVVRKIVYVWFLTMPFTAILSGIIMKLIFLWSK